MGWGPIDDIVRGAGNVIDNVDEGFDNALNAARNAASRVSLSDAGHLALDGLGMVPVVGEVADLANAGWYLAEGNRVDAALSAAGAIPFAGNAATAAKWGRHAVNAVDAASDAARVADTATDVARTADTATDSARMVDNASTTGAAPVQRGGAGPVRKGEEGVQRSITAAEGRGETVLGREVTFEAPNGTRTRVDVLTQKPNGDYVGIESKNGPHARLTPNQGDAYPQLETQGGTPRGKNAAAAGLEPNQPMPPFEIRIDRH